MTHKRTRICLIASACFALIFSAELHAQKPVVAIFAWDEKARESSDSGEFRILQVGEPASSLTVKIKMEGTASDGLDYRCFKDTWKISKKNRNNDTEISPDSIGETTAATATTLKPQGQSTASTQLQEEQQQ